MPPPPRKARARIAVLLSGSGRTLLNLVERAKAGTLPIEVAVVVASRECLGAERARGLGIPTRVIAGDVPAGELERVVKEAPGGGAEWVVLAGYLRRVNIPASLEGRVVNIHPALLPAFGGRGMYGDRVHEAVLAAGCKVSGCTVHLCDAEYDRGPILVQRACEVRDGDTAHDLAARVFELECEAYPAAIKALVDGRVRVEGGRARIGPEVAS